MTDDIDDVDMIRGLVRAAESKEQVDGGRVWDSTVSDALAAARARGWGSNRVGKLDAHAVIEKLRAERDKARYEHTQIVAERDEALAEVAQLRGIQAGENQLRRTT